jgi:hypothetical protein
MMIVSSSKFRTNSRPTASRGEPCRPNSLNGTVSGDGWRLSRTCVSEAFFQLLGETSKTAHLAHIRQHGDAPEQQRATKSGTRPLKGEFSCGIHFKTDRDGPPLALHLTSGAVSDTTQPRTSLDIGRDVKPRAALTDKGYGSDSNRAACRARGIVLSFPIVRTLKTS